MRRSADAGAGWGGLFGGGGEFVVVRGPLRDPLDAYLAGVRRVQEELSCCPCEGAAVYNHYLAATEEEQRAAP